MAPGASSPAATIHTPRPPRVKYERSHGECFAIFGLWGPLPNLGTVKQMDRDAKPVPGKGPRTLGARVVQTIRDVGGPGYPPPCLLHAWPVYVKRAASGTHQCAEQAVKTCEDWFHQPRKKLCTSASQTPDAPTVRPMAAPAPMRLDHCTVPLSHRHFRQPAPQSESTLSSPLLIAGASSSFSPSATSGFSTRSNFCRRAWSAKNTQARDQLTAQRHPLL